MRDKADIGAFIDGIVGEITALSDSIWDYAETAFTETRSAALLADFLQDRDFTVERGVAGIPTAFIAAYASGDGSPHIGILGEYDALSNLAQTAGSVTPDAPTGQPGHGCGHHLLGAGSVAAALAVRDSLIQTGIPGRVTYFGCPGEEGGSGKTFMARAAVFDGLDAALTWHPGEKNYVETASHLANYQILYRFHGTAAHAAASPHLGRSALDAVELMNVGVQFLREHIPPSARIHYAITNAGGYSPNVVQAEASALYLIRMPLASELPALYERVNDIARGAALMTGTSCEIEFIKACSHTVPNVVLSRAMHRNMLAIGAPTYSDEEIRFAETLRLSVPDASGEPIMAEIEPFVDATAEIKPGSTDIGDVSLICPLSCCYTTSVPNGAAAHTWQWTSCGKTSIAHKGMIYAAKVVAATALELFDGDLLAAARSEFENKRAGQPYVCPIPAGVRPRALEGIG